MLLICWKTTDAEMIFLILANSLLVLLQLMSGKVLKSRGIPAILHCLENFCIVCTHYVHTSEIISGRLYGDGICFANVDILESIPSTPLNGSLRNFNTLLVSVSNRTL